MYEPSELIGALVNFGGDPFLVETDEQAEQVVKSLNNATGISEITDEDDFATAMAQLDLTEAHNVAKIYAFIDNGCGAVICFPEDWDYPE